MKPSNSAPTWQTLEQLMTAPSAGRPSRRQWHPQPTTPTWLKRLLAFVTGSMEVQVEQRRDRQGQPYWAVYDPQTSQHHRFDTEQEVRIWIDQRYYH